MPNDRIAGRAVVIGGSMAGLLAARVLADQFGEVVIVDRDTFPLGPEPRKGVPQSRHLHVLLARGHRILEHLFPGLLDELIAAGAVPLRWPQDMLWLGIRGWAGRSARGLTFISCRRELLEQRVRQRVLDRPGVRTRQGHDAIGLLATTTQSTVRGVRLRARTDQTDLDIEADLVVDASGRGSHAPEWLEAIGFASPRETVINSFLGYASRLYERSEDGDRDWKGLFLQPNAPEGTRAAALLPVDGNRWHATVAGIARDYPPTDEQGFLDFARSLRTPVFYETIRAARPLTPITAYRSTQNQLRHYDRLARWPERFVVIGDAVCCFNPIYGQGMTVAGESAMELQRWLRDGGAAHEFQRRLARTIATPWLLSTGEDFRYPTTEGGRPTPMTRLMHRYLSRVVAKARTDDVVAHHLIHVLQMVAPPTTLFHPEVVARALRGGGTSSGNIGPPPTRPAEIEPPMTRAGSDLTERFVEVDDGVRLHIVESGSGPLVVLLHGYPEFWYSWRHQIPALAGAGFRAVAVDLRGYNTSDKPLGVDAYRLPTLARDVARLIPRLGAEQAVVVGHDWGGVIAWHLAMHHPEVVRRLVVMNAPHPERFRAGMRSLRQLRRSWYIGFYQLPAIPEAYVRWGDYGFLRTAFRGAARPNAFTPDDVQRYRDALSRPGALTAALNYYRAVPRVMLDTANDPNRSRRIDAPALVIWGEQDIFLGPELAEPDRSLVPDLRVERLPQASHWVQMDQPELVNDLLLEFIGAEKAAVLV
jgi:pimeloyl-ACP methyl ester carboxylesterase/2-polyprenyl-6-methoxyphenol hydroxylase-like FAD-dependent oxidoreductase